MSWLKDRWEEVTAQVKMGDNQTASTVRAARAKAAPATTRVNTNQPGWSVRKPQQPLTTQQRIDQSYGGGFSGIKNRVIDTFDANTEADRIKRFARTGLNESYEQQDARLRKQRIESELKASEAKRDAGGYSNYAPTKAANTVMSGAIRSIHGIGQGMGGLVDLVTPGKGTNRLTDFTKDYGEVWDKKREHAGVNKTAYQLAQLPMTLYGYSVGDKAITGTAQLAAKGISAIPKVGAIVPKVAGAVDTISKSKPMVSAATKLDDIALNGTRAQRVGAKLAQSYAKPGTMGNITALNTLQNAGERSSRGQDNNWGTFATDIATGLAMQGGLNLAGQAGAGVVRGVSNRIIEPTTNLVQRGKSELATGLNTINRGANQHTPYTQLVPTESGRQIVSPRDSGRVIRENLDEISEKTRARIQAAREKVPERLKLNKYGGSNADFDSPTIRNDLTGETIPNPAYRGKNVDPLESLKQEARKYRSAEEFLQAKADEGGKLSDTLEPFGKRTPEQADLENLHYAVNLYDNLPDNKAAIKKFTDIYNQATQSQPPKSPLKTDPLESLKQEATTVEKFGWKSEVTPEGTKLINRDGKHVATITEKKGRFTASYVDGQRIATGLDANKLAEDVARKTFYAQEIPQNTGGTIRPDKTPEPFKNNVWQSEMSPERAIATQANVDSMKASLEFDKTPTPKKAYHSTASLEIEGGKLRASSDGVMGEGVYLHTDPNTAKYAGAMQADGNIADQQALDINLKTDNLYKWADQNYPTSEQLALIKKRGYDGVYKKGGEIVVFDPNKIELSKATNFKTKSTAEPNTVDLDTNSIPQKATQSQPPKSTAVQPDPLESLKQEARKYKSAEEFRKNLVYNDNIIIHQTGKSTADKIKAEGFKSGKETGLGEKRSEVYGMTAYDWNKHSKFTKDTYARDGSDVAEVAIDTKGLKIADRTKQKFTDEEYVKGIHKQIPDGYDGVKVGYGNGVNEVLLKPEVASARRFNIDDLYNQSQPPKSTPKTVEAKPPTPFEQNLQTAGLAPKKAKGLVVSETKPLNGQKIQKVRTAPGEVEQRVVQDRSDEIADALGMPAKDRVPTTDSQRAERVDTAAQNGLENIKNNPEIVRQAAAPSTLKDKTKRKTFEEATKKYLGGTRSAEIERQATIASLNKEFKLSDKEKINAIISRDDPSVPALNEKVMRYNDRFKQLTDAAYKTYTDQGVKMGYVSSYLPRIYKNPETGQEVDLPEFKALIQGSKRMKGREAEKVAVDWLVEKDPTKLLERYYKSMDNAVAGRQYMKDLEDNGLVTASTEPVRGMRPVIAEGLQTDGKVFYAQKDVAHKLNELFGSKEATNLVEKTLEKGAGVNSLFQSFVLSGGVPNTPINAFGMMQLLKEGMALHPIKAGRAFFGGGLSKSYANKVFTAKKDIMKLMVENDLDIRVNLEQTGKWGNKRIRDAFKNEGKAAGLNQAWNEFTNDATFGRFMPMLEVLHFENVYKHQLKGSLIRKPKSSAEAARIAAESTKNFYGKTSVYKTSTRSKAVDDAAGALLFAPRFRESMVNFWVKNAKALVPTNYGKAEYRDNQKFMVASAVMYAAMTMLNEAMNGARMDENPDGKKDKLIMPASVAGKFGIDTKGKDIAVPFLPSIATVPRNLASLGANLATGKFNEAGKNAKAFASMPVKTVGDILTNEDYFGNKIVQDDSSPLQKFTQAASYVASSNMQPWIREALNVKGQKWDKETKKTWGIKEKSTFETLSNAGELPLRFYKPDTYRYGENWTPRGGKDEKFNFKQQRERAALGGEIKNISKTLKLNKRQDELFKSLSSVEFNDDGTLKEDNNPFYKSQRYTALQDDGVFEAMKQKSKLNAKLNGKPIDPIFSDDLAPDQRRVLLWKKTLPPGTSDPTVKKLYEQDWYQDYRNKESAYFDSKKAWNKKMGYKDATPNTNEYPMASKEVEDAQNAYFALPKGTGDRSSFIRNNPEIWNKMIAFWDSKDAWTNGERSKLGLGAVDDEDSGGFSYGSKRSSKRGGRGSKGGSKYDYTKNLFASSSDSASTSKQLRAILEKAMSGKS